MDDDITKNGNGECASSPQNGDCFRSESETSTQLRKRKRLSAVLNKINHHLTAAGRSKSLDDNRESWPTGEGRGHTPLHGTSSNGNNGSSKDSQLAIISSASAAATTTSKEAAAAVAMCKNVQVPAERPSSLRRRRLPRRSSCSTSLNKNAYKSKSAHYPICSDFGTMASTKWNSDGEGSHAHTSSGLKGDDLPGPDSVPMEDAARKMSTTAALRREQWRDTQQESVEDSQMHTLQRKYLSTRGKTGSSNSSAGSSDVFKFDSFDRDKYFSPQQTSVTGGTAATGVGAIAKDTVVESMASSSGVVTSFSAPSGASVTIHPVLQTRLILEDTGVTTTPILGSSVSFTTGSHLSAASPDVDIVLSSPVSGRSPHSSLSSPQVSVDSPRICFSPLRIKDSIEETEEDEGRQGQQLILAQRGKVQQQQQAMSTHSSPSPIVSNSHQHINVQPMQQPVNLPKLSVRGCEEENVDGSSTNDKFDGNVCNSLLSNNLAPMAPAARSRPASPNSSLTPSTPISPSTPRHLKHLPVYLTDFYRRRCLSDTDLSASWEDLTKSKSGSMLQSHITPSSKSTTVAASAVPSITAILQESKGQELPRVFPPLPRPSQVCRSPTAIGSGGSGRFLSLPSNKGGSLESEASGSSTQDIQDCPLDLSVRSGDGQIVGHPEDSMGSIGARAISPGCLGTSRITEMENSGNCGLKTGVSMDSVIMQLTSPSALVVSAPTTGRTRGKSLNRSSGNRTRGASGGGSSTTDRFSLDRQDQSGPPVVENTPGSNNDVAYACPVCGQMFGIHYFNLGIDGSEYIVAFF